MVTSMYLNVVFGPVVDSEAAVNGSALSTACLIWGGAWGLWLWWGGFLGLGFGLRSVGVGLMLDQIDEEVILLLPDPSLDACSWWLCVLVAQPFLDSLLCRRFILSGLPEGGDPVLGFGGRTGIGFIGGGWGLFGWGFYV